MDHNVAPSVVDLVNLDLCPIEYLDSEEGASFARVARQRFLEDGLCVLPEFIRPEALAVLAEEANRCIEDAWFCSGAHQRVSRRGPSRLPIGRHRGARGSDLRRLDSLRSAERRLLAPVPVPVGPAQGLHRCGARQAPDSIALPIRSARAR